MKVKRNKKYINYFIAAVWITNGLLCKILNLVPRHQLIVAEILGNEYARSFTMLIGFAELVLAIWILSNLKSRWNALLQITLVAGMNIIEFFTVPEILLFGRWNIVFAFLFILVIYYNEFQNDFIVNKKTEGL